MKSKLLLTGMLAAVGLSGCDSEAAVNKLNATKMKHNHSTEYSCPMHPEIKGKEGEACQKCGMKLKAVHTQKGTAYFMKFATSVDIIEPDKELTLSFTPKKEDSDNKQVPLDVQHEKKVHLIIVSEDLSYFDHIHPEMNADGEYAINTSFPHAGKYHLYADYKPKGAGQVVDRLEINVAGSPPKSSVYTKEKLINSAGEYSLTLRPAKGRIAAGTTSNILGILEKNGKQLDVNALENYLGAKAHTVIIGVEDKKFLHVHPMVHNGMLQIHADFDKPGIYRGWVQFQDGSVLHTIDVTFNVEAREPGSQAHDAKEHPHLHEH